MTRPTRFRGTFAAPVTPVDPDGRIDAPRLRALVEFLLEGGADGLCLGGWTSEYPRFSIPERKHYVDEAADQIAGRAPYVVAVGGASVRDVVELGRHAIEHGAAALLLPMPYFYTFDQADLAAYVRYATAHLDHPCILYNLPAGRNRLEPATAVRLLKEIPNLVGIKDSSGSREGVRVLAEARGDANWSLLTGADDLILESLEAGWDGIISGVACCCPELVTLLYHRHRNGNAASARVAQQLVVELLEAIRRLPGPSAIRVALEARGLPTGPFPYPVAQERRIEELKTFFDTWFEEHLSSLRDELKSMTEH